MLVVARDRVHLNIELDQRIRHNGERYRAPHLCRSRASRLGVPHEERGISAIRHLLPARIRTAGVVGCPMGPYPCIPQASSQVARRSVNVHETPMNYGASAITLPPSNASFVPKPSPPDA